MGLCKTLAGWAMSYHLTLEFDFFNAFTKYSLCIAVMTSSPRLRSLGSHCMFFFSASASLRVVLLVCVVNSFLFCSQGWSRLDPVHNNNLMVCIFHKCLLFHWFHYPLSYFKNQCWGPGFVWCQPWIWLLLSLSILTDAVVYRTK